MAVRGGHGGGRTGGVRPGPPRSDRPAPVTGIPGLEPLTVAELLCGGPLNTARLACDVPLDRPVAEVRLLDDAAAAISCPPHTALVLTEQAARGGWAVEVTLRQAWERAAACVIAHESVVTSPIADQVATRLGVPLLAVPDDPHSAALRVAAAIARPEATRSALIARCALRLAESGENARAVLGTLNAELPGVHVALITGSGTLLAGRAAALEAWQTPDPAITVLSTPIPGPDGLELGQLIAAVTGRAKAWHTTITAVLSIALAPLTAWAATERLRTDRAPRLATALLDRLLTEETPETLVEATALGWPLDGPLVGIALLRTGPAQDLTAALTGALTAAWDLPGPLVAHGEGWVSWCRDPISWDPALNRLNAITGLAAGVAGPDRDLRRLLTQAGAAAVVARSHGPGTLVRAGELGPARLLAALPAELSGTARDVLAPVLAADTDGTLLATLTSVLDLGGSAKDAAAALGVHRNTVATRLERLRELGVDPTDPRQRLPLHLACHLVR
ncbi:PucR family transcriptional regulator [Pseudonocardiaceae bacterium YIM PH 21723]|nr:PucR family transcriptional regulator [Pseudonocardiaceae bacterium YIM PH 21723]